MNLKSMMTSKKVFWWVFGFMALNWVGYAIMEYLTCGFATWDTGAHIQPVIHWALWRIRRQDVIGWAPLF